MTFHHIFKLFHKFAKRSKPFARCERLRRLKQFWSSGGPPWAEERMELSASPYLWTSLISMGCRGGVPTLSDKTSNFILPHQSIFKWGSLKKVRLNTLAAKLEQTKLLK